jgi:hypothetical protein
MMFERVVDDPGQNLIANQDTLHILWTKQLDAEKSAVLFTHLNVLEWELVMPPITLVSRTLYPCPVRL